MSNLSQQQKNNFWSKMIFEQQNQKKFPEKNFLSEKNLGNNKIWEKIPSRSDYCITLSQCHNVVLHKKSKKKTNN